MPQPTASDAAGLIARLTQAGAPFELSSVELQGRSYKAYRHAPRTLVDQLQAARAHGAKEFMAYEGERWSYDRFFAEADALASWMRVSAGVQPGERVAIAMRNCPQWAVAFAASVLVGAIAAPLNSFGQRDELRAALAELGAQLLVCDNERLRRISPDADFPLASVLVWGGMPLPGGTPAGPVENAPHSASSSSCSSLFAWDDARHQGAATLAGHALQPHAAEPDDPALLLSTSGSASRPKAVLSTHRAICQALMNIDFIGALSGMGSPEIVAGLMSRGLSPATLTAVPLFHVSGLHAQLLTNLRHGRRLVFLHRWSPQEAWQMIRSEGITQFNGAPAMVQQLLEHPGLDPATDARTLAALGFGGSGLPQRLIDEVLRLFPQSMSGTGFGLTETNGVGTAISGAWFMARPRSSGLPSPLMELRFIGDNGEDQPPGMPGEIWFRGITLMREYWRQPEASAHALADGWFRSGDVGYQDEAGFLFIVDRLKDVINRSGEKIAAAEVESCLSLHPGIAESAVLAVPDDATGEAVLAVVVPKEGIPLTGEDIQRHVAARLAGYKVPTQVVVRAEPLPRNATGKLLKSRLRAEYPKP